MEASDWHDLEEHRFAKDIASVLEGLVLEHKIEALVIAAPPRTLSDLRQALRPEVRRHVIAEFDKDLTHHSVREIEKHLVGYSILPGD